ncbi:MAG TPA: rRNA pseudouridine synthase [Anaerolineae bacterium]|nr:rRNA pseudouridine synthase [Anaerolineae bacterium]
MKVERLQKVLARSGYGSRRSCEDLIRAGRVTINGRRADIGTLVNPEVDEIYVNGDQLKPAERKVYIVLNKPVGVLSSLRSQGGKPTVRDLIKTKERVYPVGRLDVDSEGLILLTNDGELTDRLTHPRYGHEKEYRVLLNRKPDDTQLDVWRNGVVLPDGSKSLPARCWLEDDQGQTPWLRVVMRQGRKRQIRETARALGLQVRKLIRVRIGRLRLGDLQPGQYRELSQNDIHTMFNILDKP